MKHQIKNLAININVNSFEELRKLVGAHEEATPGEVFENLITNKKICTRSILKEMFRLSDRELRYVIYEGRYLYDRGLFDNENALWLLTIDHDFDYEKMEAIPIQFSPAQEQLRAVMVKRINLIRFERMAGDVEEDYGYGILYDIYDEVEEKYHISEEEVMAALSTYQEEHLS